MAEAYIIDAVRTPVGRRKGALSTAHPADLGAHVLKGLLNRTGVDPEAIEDVVFGCLDTLGHQAGDIARTCALAAGMPLHVPGTSVDRQFGKGCMGESQTERGGEEKSHVGLLGEEAGRMR